MAKKRPTPRAAGWDHAGGEYLLPVHALAPSEIDEMRIEADAHPDWLLGRKFSTLLDAYEELQQTKIKAWKDEQEQKKLIDAGGRRG